MIPCNDCAAARILTKAVWREFIAACSNNAEAGWESTRSTIEQIISMRKDTACWGFVGNPLMESLLTQWPLESLVANG